MAIDSVNEIGGRSKDFGEDMSRKYRRRYRVVSTVLNEDEATVEAAVPVALFDGHPSDAGSLAVAFTVEQDAEEPYFWIVEIRYSPLSFQTQGSNTRGSDPSQRTENPLNRPAILSLDGDPFQQVAVRQLDGRSVLNSAFDRFDPPVMRQATRPTITITKNVASVNYQAWRYRHNTLNSATYLGFTAGTLMLTKLGYRSQFENNLYFYEATAQFAAALEDEGSFGSGSPSFPLSWQPKVLDEGYHELIFGFSGGAVTSRKQKIMLPGGAEPSTPVRLNGVGRALAADAALEDSVYLQFNLYKSFNFDDLGLL